MQSNFFKSVRGCTALGTVGALGVLLVTAVPVRAQIVNGGFEDGTFSGWTMISGHYSTGGHSPDLPSVGMSLVVPPPSPDPVTLLPVVYAGTYAARINGTTAVSTYTNMSQTFTTTREVDVFFAWSAVLQRTPTPSSNPLYVPPANRPKFSIILHDSVAGDIITISYNGNTLAADYYGGPVWAYSDWQYEHMVVSAGRVLTLSVQAEGSSSDYPGYAGYLYLDIFGATGTGRDPGGYNASGAPEPGTVALGLSALAMAGGSFLLKLRRRQTTSKS